MYIIFVWRGSRCTVRPREYVLQLFLPTEHDNIIVSRNHDTATAVGARE